MAGLQSSFKGESRGQCQARGQRTVVGRLLGCGDVSIELVVSSVVDVRNTESETRRNGDAKGQLALFPVVPDRNSGACLSVELAEGYSDSSLISC